MLARDRYRFHIKVTRLNESWSAIITNVGATDVGAETDIEFEFLLPDAPDLGYGDQIEVGPGYFIGVVTPHPLVQQNTTPSMSPGVANYG